MEVFMTILNSSFSILARWISIAALGCSLGACGGDPSRNAADNTALDATNAAFSLSESVNAQALARGARLSHSELLAADKAAQVAEAASAFEAQNSLPAGQIAAKSAYLSGAVAHKAGAVRVPAFRFFNSDTGAHFFTTSITERDNLVSMMGSPFRLEGEAFSVASDFSPGLSPVHRFHNTQTGVHFYTISEEERANVVATLPHFVYEGVAYHASKVMGLGLTPFYRFFAPTKGIHFYTSSEDEKDNIIANLGDVYAFEGVGYYVLDSNWRSERLPHTGVTAAHCYQLGGFTRNEGSNISLGDCSHANALSINIHQDGHRTEINPMRYREVAKPSGGNFARTDCVEDAVTGMIWEGKEASGVRRGSNTYRDNGFINVPTVTVTDYVRNVNVQNLCGFSDWRLPTRNELIGIGDYGGTHIAGINAIWFPNTSSAAAYWTSEALAANHTINAAVWAVWFSTGGASGSLDSSYPWAVRLVRGDTPQAPRFSYSSIAYGNDQANNVVNDAWTGLQWRRCEQGRVWSGSTCTGVPTYFPQYGALMHARDQNGWRLPSIKELSSLTELNATGGALIDGTAFPGITKTSFWSSTPLFSDVAGGWFADVAVGQIYAEYRVSHFAVRLVRLNQ